MAAAQRLRYALATAGLLILALLLGLWLLLRLSLPAVDGRARLVGLAAAVEVTRDPNGVPTLTGQNRADLARALGYVHGEDRFFQMDLLRRAAAGELSALFGRATLEADRKLRVHRFRAVARAALARAGADRRALIEAYSEGVNQGLASLKTRPPEYWLLGSVPEPWRPEDSILVVHAMFLQLQEPDGHTQIERGLIRAALPEAAWRFLYAPAADWDAPIDGSTMTAPALPTAAEYDLRTQAVEAPGGEGLSVRHGDDTGSNNWAAAGSRTASGAALVANDMHLDLRVPNAWYRARLIGQSPAVDITGVTLPGTPVVAAGSNGHIAWGFTNSYGDFEDVVALVPAPGAPGRYETAQGVEPVQEIEETITVRGASPERMIVTESRFGPVIDRDAQGRGLALAWIAHDPDAVNMELLDLEQAQTVADGLKVAARTGMPAQNLMVGDAAGHIAWTIIGLLPAHATPSDRGLTLSTDPGAGLGAPVPAATRPSVVDPAAGLLWSANSRVVGGEALATIGDGGYDRGSRARQIAADLQAAATPLTPRASLAIQLDDRADFLARWHSLLDELLDSSVVAGHPTRQALKATLARWSGHAATDDAAYRAVRAFRLEVEARSFAMLIAPARARAPGVHFSVPPSFEGPLWRLVTERPPHLLSGRYRDWREFLLAAADRAAVVPSACTTLERCTWGRVNALAMAHPLSSALPMLRYALDMGRDALPGDNDMPRVAGHTLGASERFDVSPGHEAEGIFEMPGGESGHPLSPYYRAGHDDWLHGRPTPFLPGPARHHLTLEP